MLSEEEAPIQPTASNFGEEKPRFRTISGQKRSFWTDSSDQNASSGCSLQNLRQMVARRLPFLRWIPAYSPKDQLGGDLVGGLMGAVMNITKGAAYAQLAGIPPVNGLYALCIASLVYPLLASWSQGSMCAFAIIQLMCGAAARDVLAQFDAENGTTVGRGEGLNAAIIVSTLTFFNGLIFAAFGALRLQFLTVHFSKPLISGFLTAAALHLAAAQAGNVFGLKMTTKTEKKFGQLFRDMFSLIVRIPEANWATVGFSAISFVVLLGAKFVLDAPIRRLAGGRKLQIPWELILVLLITATVFLFDMRSEFGVQTVGEVPGGLPHITLPRLDLLPVLFQHSLTISIVQLAFHCSLAKVMCRRKGYSVDESQEVRAMSLVHVVLGFFPSFPTTNGLGRAAVLDECGATSLFASIITGLVLLSVLLAAGPLFSWIPLCVLAVIVLVSVRGLFDGFRELPHYWRLSKWDGAIWAVTFLSSTCFDVIIGLATGVAFQLLALATRMQWPQWSAQQSDSVCVFRFDLPLFFSNAEIFKAAVHEALDRWTSEGEKKGGRTFVFDCSAFTTFDSVGIETFGSSIRELRKTFERYVLFVHLDEEVRSGLEAVGTKIEEDSCFHSTQEAIDFAFQQSQTVKTEETSRKEVDFVTKPTAAHKLLPPA